MGDNSPQNDYKNWGMGRLQPHTIDFLDIEDEHPLQEAFLYKYNHQWLFSLSLTNPEGGLRHQE